MQLRLEPDAGDGSTPDEGAPKRGSGWTGRGSPLLAGSQLYSTRNLRRPTPRVPRALGCGRLEISRRFHLERGGQTLQGLLGESGYAGALGIVGSWEDFELPFLSRRNRRTEAGSDLFPSDAKGLSLERHQEDRCDVPVDFRYLSLLLQAAQDPETSLGEFSRGARVGPGVRLPRLPAL